MALLTQSIGRYIVRLGLLALAALVALGAAPATQAAPLATNATTYYVNSINGSDANKGTENKPFKTLTHALTVAQAGDMVHLAAGVYSKAYNGEQFSAIGAPVLVPAGVTIEGTPADDFTTRLIGEGANLIAQGDIGLQFQGDASVKDLILEGFQYGIYATQGKQTLSNLIFIGNNVGLAMRGSAQTSLVGSSVFVKDTTWGSTGVSAVEQAQLTMDGGTITGYTNLSCDTGLTGLNVNNQAQVTLNGITFQDLPGSALYLYGDSKTTLNNSTISLTNPSGCTPKPNVNARIGASLTVNNSSISMSGGSNTVGVYAYGNGTFAFNNSSIKGHTAAGVQVITWNGIVSKLDFASSIISGNKVGIDASGGATANITISGSSLTNNSTAVLAAAPKLRNSTVSGNATGISITGTSADLGTFNEPGNNSLKGNTVTAVTFASTSASGTINAVGNVWNANTQGTDGNGLYPTHMLVIGLGGFAHGTNFDLPNSNTKIQV
jgi:hypothetical protein